MKILMINVCCGIESTGRICTDLAISLERQGHVVKIAYGRGRVPDKYQKYAVRIGNTVDVYAHALKARLFDDMGLESKYTTRKFLKWVDEFDPDIIHLHNIHGYYLNVDMLFKYLKSSNKRVIWTLHDCWAFTGHTPYCDVISCEKWKDGCIECNLLNEYPKSLFDFSKRNWLKKNEIFNGVDNMQIVTPSNWLQSLVKESFLKLYDTRVINNGINTKIFFHRNSHYLQQYNITDKHIVLGVSSVWDHMKGLDDFIKLSELLDESFKMVLVGLTPKQIKRLPNNIIGIEHTESVEELAMIYSEADVFVNLSYCENYPTVNIEALACGTPVITYETGGSPEIVKKYGGAVVEKKNIVAVKKVIETIVKKKEKVSFKPDENDVNYMIEQYLELYKVNKNSNHLFT